MLNKAINSSQHIFMLPGLCTWSAVSKCQNGTPKVARKASNMEEVWKPVCCHGNRTVKLALWSRFSRILLQRIKHFLPIGWDLFLLYLNKIWLSVWRHHLANLHILKTWISPERKEIFENSKQLFSSHAVYLFMFQNDGDWKDAIFVIVPLNNWFTL